MGCLACFALPQTSKAKKAAAGVTNCAALRVWGAEDLADGRTLASYTVLDGFQNDPIYGPRRFPKCSEFSFKKNVLRFISSEAGNEVLLYLRKVSSQLETIQVGPDEEEELVLQGVRFAFRVHQVTTPLTHVHKELICSTLQTCMLCSALPFLAVCRRFRQWYDARLSGVEGEGVNLPATGKPKPTSATAKARWQKLKHMYL